jgi:Peptidase A4 family
MVSGHAEYSAWWELIPAPSITIDMTIAPGDSMHLDIHETIANSEVWSITLTDVTRNETFTQTVPYSSTYGTAEWIEETPLLLGANAGFAALPNLTKTAFDSGSANGANPHLIPAEEIQLVNANNNKVYAVPSAPDKDTDGGGLCAWATSCTVPSS